MSTSGTTSIRAAALSHRGRLTLHSDSVSRHQRRLLFESLESRRLLAISVDTVADVVDAGDGLTSLREAIATANTSSDNEIDFSVVGKIDLLLGELEISDTLTIHGPGQALLTIDAQQNSRILNFTSTTGDLTLEAMTLTGGKTTGGNTYLGGGQGFETTHNGGGIRFLSDGTLTLTSSTVSGNSTDGDRADGGGIFSQGAVTLNQSTVSGNRTAGNISEGGGIRTSGAVALTQSTVSGNSTAGDSADGGGIHASGDVALTQSNVSGNRTVGSSSEGGGIRTAGAVTLAQSTVSGNSTADGGDGGGINAVGAVTLTQSTVSGNSTAGDYSFGGGIWAFNSVTLNQSTVSGNSTAGSHAYGGGIYARLAVSLTQSTVSGNSTAGDQAFGGGIYTRGAVTLTQSTITDNHVTHGTATGGGIWNSDDPINVSGSIVAGNRAGGGNPDLRLGTGTLAVNYSLIGTEIKPDASASGNNVETDTPLLGPLANNGGPTQTHALLPGSPALHAGDPTMLFDLTEFDQRGLPFFRVAPATSPAAQIIDIGAYEAQMDPSADFDTDGDVDGADFLAWQRGFGKINAQRADGNSDDDTDTDAADLAAWEVSFGQPQALMTSASTQQTVYASEPVIAFAAADAELIDAAIESSLLTGMVDRDGGVDDLLADEATVIDAAVAKSETNDSVALGLTAEATELESKMTSTVPANDPNTTWLADQLLERAFGIMAMIRVGS